jgi:FkbM family methyltransferase
MSLGGMMTAGKFLKASLQHFGYDVTEYPIPDWYLLRKGLTEIFAALQIDCVIDVGANRGQYGDFLRRIGYKGRIDSFEPVATSFKLLEERCKSDPTWHAHNLALGAKDEAHEINVMNRDEFSSLLPLNSYGNAQFQKEAAVTRTETVKVARLDSVINMVTEGLNNPRIYLKLDTQGYDLEVMNGASGCLPLLMGLQSEIALRPIYQGMPDYLTALTKFNNLGFSITSICPVSRDENLRVIEFDCLMVRNS